MSNQIANNIKILRLKHGETQKQLAEAIGVSIMAISKYESGNAIPSDDNKVKISRHYNMSVESIFYPKI